MKWKSATFSIPKRQVVHIFYNSLMNWEHQDLEFKILYWRTRSEPCFQMKCFTVLKSMLGSSAFKQISFVIAQTFVAVYAICIQVVFNPLIPVEPAIQTKDFSNFQGHFWKQKLGCECDTALHSTIQPS